MLFFRAWELRTGRVTLSEEMITWNPQLSFRQTEKTVLYLTKYIVQGIVFTGAKYWFIVTTKAKNEIKKIPKVHAILQKKQSATPTSNSKISFLQRSVIESKMKIRRIREKVKKEHEEEIIVKEVAKNE